MKKHRTKILLKIQRAYAVHIGKIFVTNFYAYDMFYKAADQLPPFYN